MDIIMGFELRDGVSFCVIDDTAIFLDMAADRYFTLSRDANLRFLALVSGETLAVAPDRFAFLQTSNRDGVPAPLMVAPPVRSLLDEGLPTPSVVQVVRAVAEQSTAAVMLRRRRLRHNLVDRFATGRVPVWNEHDAKRIASSFEAAGRLIGITDRCLRFSFAMWRRMRRAGLPATLVFGVTNRPFSAHCWVQSSGTVCSDRLEHVRWFTPIAAL